MMKSLQGRDREQGLLQGTEVLLRNGDDTRSSLHLSVVTFRVLRWRRQEGQRIGSLLELTWPKARDRSCNKNRIIRDEMRASTVSSQQKGTSLNWNNRGKATSLDWGSS
jgi:hypothetical protein